MISIALATVDDVDDVVQLLSAQFEEHGIALDGRALRAAVCGPIEEPSRGAFLLARDGRCVGVVYIAYIWTLEHGGQSAWLEELYVIPGMRSRGVGTRLLRAAMAHAAGAGCVAIDLEVDADHARAANLYAREGFHALRRARWFARL